MAIKLKGHGVIISIGLLPYMKTGDHKVDDVIRVLHDSIDDDDHHPNYIHGMKVTDPKNLLEDLKLIYNKISDLQYSDDDQKIKDIVHLLNTFTNDPDNPFDHDDPTIIIKEMCDADNRRILLKGINKSIRELDKVVNSHDSDSDSDSESDSDPESDSGPDRDSDNYSVYSVDLDDEEKKTIINTFCITLISDKEKETVITFCNKLAYLDDDADPNSPEMDDVVGMLDDLKKQEGGSSIISDFRTDSRIRDAIFKRIVQILEITYGYRDLYKHDCTLPPYKEMLRRKRDIHEDFIKPYGAIKNHLQKKYNITTAFMPCIVPQAGDIFIIFMHKNKYYVKKILIQMGLRPKDLPCTSKIKKTLREIMLFACT